MDTDSRAPARFHLVDALRGIAALSVVLFHAVEGGHVTELVSHFPPMIVLILEHGNLGVPVFFVLSGFVIAHSLYNRKMDIRVLARFALRRSVRLDPPYWVAIFVALSFSIVASKFVAGRPLESYSSAQVLAHFVYAQTILGYPQINPVFWTLCLEVQFYLVYAALLGLGRNEPSAAMQGRRVVAVFAAAALVSLLWPLGVGPAVHQGIFLPLWFGFLLGAGAYWAWRNDQLRPAYFCYLGILTFCAVRQSSLFTAICCLTATILFFAGRTKSIAKMNWPWIQGLGAVSYSLYLVHNPITGATFRIGYLLTGNSTGWQIVWWVVSIGTCLLSAALLWAVVERPSTRLATKIRFNRAPATRTMMLQPAVADRKSSVVE